MQINITATLGTLNVAADVDGVKIKGDGEMHMTLSSSLLPNLNRQLQFVTYTNTLFHPSTADTGEASNKYPFLSPYNLIFFKFEYFVKCNMCPLVESKMRRRISLFVLDKLNVKL